MKEALGLRSHVVFVVVLFFAYLDCLSSVHAVIRF